MPDPLTPVTHVSAFSGIADVDVLQVVLGRADQPNLLPGAAPPRRRNRNRQLLRRYFEVSDRGSCISPSSVPENTTRAALLAGAEPQVDDVVGDLDHVGVVLDDQHGVALVAKLPEDVDQPQIVARMQADRRLVEHVQRADQRRTERRRQVDALRFAAGQRRRQTIERQVVEADIAQERQPAPDLLEDLVGDGRFLLGELQRREELLRLAHRQRRDLVDRAADDAHVARFARAAGCRRSPDTSGSRGSG